VLDNELEVTKERLVDTESELTAVTERNFVLMERNNVLEGKLRSSNGRLAAISLMFERVNALDAAKCLLKELSAHGVQDGDIVEGVMNALMEKKIQKAYPEFSTFTGGAFKASKNSL
jgi:hypothetical protein